jgi:hypothetical protein
MIATLQQLRERRTAVKAISGSVALYSFRDEDCSGLSRLLTLPRFACDVFTSNVDSIFLLSDASNSTLIDMSPLRRTRHLGIYSDTIDDHGIAAIHDWDHLECFSTHRSQITSRGIANSDWLRTVASLSLLDCPIDDNLWQHLEDNTRLVDLGIGGTRIRNLAPLAKHPHIHSLCVNSLPVRLDELASFPFATNLSELYINATPIDDSSFRSLIRMPNIVDLAVGDTAISDAAFKYIAQLSQLEELVVNDTCVTDYGISLLADLPNLRFLCITNTKASTSAIPILSRFAKLKTVFMDASLLDHLSQDERNALPFDAVPIDDES